MQLPDALVIHAHVSHVLLRVCVEVGAMGYWIWAQELRALCSLRERALNSFGCSAE